MTSGWIINGDSLTETVTFTASTDKWGGGASTWLDGPVIKLHSKDNGVVSEEGIDLI